MYYHWSAFSPKLGAECWMLNTLITVCCIYRSVLTKYTLLCTKWQVLKPLYCSPRLPPPLRQTLKPRPSLTSQTRRWKMQGKGQFYFDPLHVSLVPFPPWGGRGVGGWGDRQPISPPLTTAQLTLWELQGAAVELCACANSERNVWS